MTSDAVRRDSLHNLNACFGEIDSHVCCSDDRTILAQDMQTLSSMTMQANDNGTTGNSTVTCTVVKHRQKWRSGHEKWVSRVVFSDGKTITFMDLLTKREATKQALELRARDGLAALDG